MRSTITLQDVLTRRERMLGKDALWVVGTDHAGIATQMVVERNLESQGIKRAEIGREAFLEHVWEWKAESGGAITRQLRRLGASCDWAHERFTMDERYQRAVIHTFVELHKRGLIYRDKRLVNWDPRFQTAISDLEVETREVQGKFWTLKYPLEDGSGAIQVATTRPETMLADMAVAVHPDDKRYKKLVGRKIKHPITGRLIPIVADEHADPELGSGAVKITPGHDFNDFEVGRRAGFEARDMLNMFDGTANVVQTQDKLNPKELLGLSREEARKRVVELLEAANALVSVEDRVIPTPYGDRSGAVIEPWLTDQWYVDAARLVVPVLEATRKGDIRIVPETWKKTWFNWLENIQPWCVSRQLWWGHRIPAWYGPSNGLRQMAVRSFGATTGPTNPKIFVGSEEQVLAEAQDYYGGEYDITLSESGELLTCGQGLPLVRDKDVPRHLVLVRAVAVRDARLARTDRRPQAPLPQRRPHLGLRHPLLLGRADGDAGHRAHAAAAVEDALPPRPGPRRARPKNVQVEGQHRRPARPDRQIWRRRAALHAGGDGEPGPRHQAR